MGVGATTVGTVLPYQFLRLPTTKNGVKGKKRKKERGKGRREGKKGKETRKRWEEELKKKIFHVTLYNFRSHFTLALPVGHYSKGLNDIQYIQFEISIQAIFQLAYRAFIIWFNLHILFMILKSILSKMSRFHACTQKFQLALRARIIWFVKYVSLSWILPTKKWLSKYPFYMSNCLNLSACAVRSHLDYLDMYTSLYILTNSS